MYISHHVRVRISVAFLKPSPFMRTMLYTCFNAVNIHLDMLALCVYITLYANAAFGQSDALK